MTEYMVPATEIKVKITPPAPTPIDRKAVLRDLGRRRVERDAALVSADAALDAARQRFGAAQRQLAEAQARRAEIVDAFEAAERTAHAALRRDAADLVASIRAALHRRQARLLSSSGTDYAARARALEAVTAAIRDIDHVVLAADPSKEIAAIHKQIPGLDDRD